MENNNFQASGSVRLPLPPMSPKLFETEREMEIYVRFMRSFREGVSSRMEIRILNAIQFVADMTDSDDAGVATVLVHLGLKAPRDAFPASYLESVDRVQQRDEGGGPGTLVSRSDAHTRPCPPDGRNEIPGACRSFRFHCPDRGDLQRESSPVNPRTPR